MGKKNKMINEDPILKKNFKLQKRKKQRELEKLKLKEQEEQEAKRLQELRLIEKQVQATLETQFQQEKLMLTQVSKHKSINKKLPFISAFKNPEGFNSSAVPKESTKQFQEQFTKHLSTYSIKNVQKSYEKHFQENLPKEVKESMIKVKQVSQTAKMEQQIRAEINSMFSVRKIGEEEEQNVAKKQDKKGSFGRKQEKIQAEFEEALQEEEKKEEPFILDRKVKTETEGLVSNQILAFSKLVLHSLTESKNQMVDEIQEGNQEVAKQYKTAENLIRNYVDYVHIQNREEQTIQELRKIVIRHMYSHHLNCLKALTSNEKSKGFTNAKFLIVTPYVGDAKAIFDLIEEQFFNLQNQPLYAETEQSSSKKKKQPHWTVQNKQKIQQNQDDQDDFFRVGIKILPKKKKIHYFSSFDSSDIIVASPIGLKSIINGESGNKQNSFLSSIQVLYVDRASVIMMQNWDHLIDVFNNLNFMPKYESLKSSINQIRPHFLQLKARIYRQNIIFTEFTFPELISLKLNHFHNWQGTATSKPIYFPISLENNQKIEKNFYKIELKQPKDDLESRFEYFKRKFWDKIHNNDQMKKVVLFVNSYFEFVKLKGFLQKVNASVILFKIQFEAISEHTKKQKIQSRISLFNNNSYRVLLLTERAYYFGLCQIKNQRHIFFYSLPKNGFIYKELIENMKEGNEEQSKIVCIYSKYDKSIVERLVGSSKAIEMVREYCTNVSFIV